MLVKVWQRSRLTSRWRRSICYLFKPKLFQTEETAPLVVTSCSVLIIVHLFYCNTCPRSATALGWKWCNCVTNGAFSTDCVFDFCLVDQSKLWAVACRAHTCTLLKDCLCLQPFSRLVPGAASPSLGPAAVAGKKTLWGITFPRGFHDSVG